jgi:hypothetical protein
LLQAVGAAVVSSFVLQQASPARAANGSLPGNAVPGAAVLPVSITHAWSLYSTKHNTSQNHSCIWIAMSLRVRRLASLVFQVWENKLYLNCCMSLSIGDEQLRWQSQYCKACIYVLKFQINDRWYCCCHHDSTARLPVIVDSSF